MKVFGTSRRRSAVTDKSRFSVNHARLPALAFTLFCCTPLLSSKPTLADPPTNTPGGAVAAPWADPSYGAWHSSVMGGGGNLDNLLISPSDPNRIYAHGDMDGLFRSDDAGKSWRIIHGGMDIYQGHYEFSGIAINPRNADQLAVAVGYQYGPRQGVFISDDGGKTWTKTLSARYLGNSKYRYAGTRIAGSCGPNGHLVTASEGSGLWRSVDGGRTWEHCGYDNIYFTDVYIDRTNPDRVWACAEPVTLQGGEYSDLAGGLYRSDDGGKTWAKLTDDSPFTVIQDPVSAGTLYGLFHDTVRRSTDNGATWQDFNAGLPAPLTTTSGPPDFLAIGTGPKFVTILQRHPMTIYRLDAGQSQWKAIKPTFSLADWRITFTRPPADDPSRVIVSPTDPNHWYMTDEWGMYQSFDAGQTWTATNRGIETTVIHAVAQDASNPAHAYLGAGDVGFWYSDDAGTAFTQTNSHAAEWLGNVKCITSSPKNASRVYAAGGVGWQANRVYVSEDGGKSMTLLHPTGLPTAAWESIVVDPNDPNSVYLATSAPVTASSGGVYHSADGGHTWTYMSAGLPVGKKAFGDNIWWGGNELAMGPDGTLIAASAGSNTVYRFDRTGGAWTPLVMPHHGGLFATAADPHTPGRFFVCVEGNEHGPSVAGGGLYRTDDAGATWKSVLPGSVHAVAVDVAVKNRVAASTTAGVFYSADGGDTWTPFDKLPNDWAFDCMAFAGNRVIVGTGGNGAFWSDLPGVRQTAAK